MYTPEDFKTNNLELVRQIMRQNSFATLINRASGSNSISHLPLHYKADGSAHGLIYGHMARVNLQWKSWQSDSQVTAIFHGPHAYISPRWYEFSTDNVPTWNYAVVHAYGRARVITDDDESYELLREMVAIYDPTWNLNLGASDRGALLSGIVAFCIDIDRVEAKLKLSQNRSLADRDSVRKNLAMSEDQIERELGELMSRFNLSQ